VSVVVALATGAVFWRSSEVVISYSLYLCYEYTSNVVWPRLFSQSHRLTSWVGITLQILLAIVGATLLHYAIERSFLRWKDRFHPRRARFSARV
jgi:peptidoglycan/LPS O-acetylase OafA/YrhL